MPGSAAIDTLERILFLKRSLQMAGLTAEELSAVAEQMRERFFQKGSVILREGESVAATYALVEGEVRVLRRGRLLGSMGPGTVLGVLGILSRDREGVQAVAETDVVALELDADTMLELFEDHFLIVRQVLEATARRFLELVSQAPAVVGELEPRTSGEFKAGGMDLVQKILFLRQTGPFKSSSINALAELSQGVREVTYEKGATLWKEGESSGTMLLLVSGRVGVAGRGGSVRFEAGPGFPLGGIETLAGEPRWYTATTKTRLFALELSVEGLIDVLEDNFDMAMDFLAAVSHVTLGLIERIAGSGGEMLGLLTHAAEPAFTNHDAAGERGSGTGE